jgi:integrase
VDLNETRIDRYIKVRLDAGRKPSTINRETQLLGQAFRLAASRRWVNRVPHIRRLPERNVRQGFFDVEKIDTVITHLPHYLQDFVRFAYLSGWRKGEIASLTWDDGTVKPASFGSVQRAQKPEQGESLLSAGSCGTLSNSDGPTVVASRGCFTGRDGP